MPRSWRIRFAGAKYHVTTRGNGRQTIFHAREDYERYLEQLATALELDGVVLYAYALLGNHTHLLIETPRGNVHRFMQRLNTAYGMYRRYKRHKPGHCFQARYDAKLVSGDKYLLRVTRYIHLNPVKTRRMSTLPAAEKLRYLESYPWSSYPGYVDKDRTEEIVNYRWLELMQCRTPARSRIAYRAYIESMVDGEDPALKEAMSASRYAIGDETFRARIDDELRDVRSQRAVYGDIVWPVNVVRGIDEVAELVGEAFGVKVADLCTHGRRAGPAKKVALELCCEYCGKSQREIGAHFCYTGNGAVGKQRAKLRELLVEDKGLARHLTRLRKRLDNS